MSLVVKKTVIILAHFDLKNFGRSRKEIRVG